MITVIKRVKSDFRIEIKDLKTGKVTTISLSDHHEATIDSIKEMIIHCIEKKEYLQVRKREEKI